MQYQFDEERSYRNMPRFDRDMLVWLDHMMKAGRKVLKSLRAQTSTKEELKLLRADVTQVANKYAAWPQAKYFLEESEEKLVKSK